MKSDTKLYTVTIFSLFVMGTAWICQMWYNNYKKCSTSFIYETCEAYKNSTLYNSLCHSICTENNFKIESCIPSTTFNKGVFAVNVQNRSTILKVHMHWFNHVKNAKNSLANPMVMSTFNVTAYFKNIISNYFGNNCSNCEELANKLITMADSDENGVTSTTEALWFGSLLTTQETFMLAALNRSKSTVNLNAYCGALYEVEKVHAANSHMVDTAKAFTDFWSLPEFAEPIESFIKDLLGDLRLNYAWFEELHRQIYIFIKRFRGDTVPTLQQRLAFILGILEMLHRLVSFKIGEVIWCDILYDNIGLTDPDDFSSVKLTDLDDMFSVRKVFQNVSESEKKCVKNKDCFGEKYDVGEYYHYECSSYCLPSGYCSQRPEKSILAYLCEGLFLDVIFNPVVLSLSNKKMSKNVGWDVYSILENCSKSVEYNSTAEYLAHIREVHGTFNKFKYMYA